MFQEEISGMLNAHVKDSVALCDVVAMLEEAIAQKGDDTWTELRVSKVEKKNRKSHHLAILWTFS